MNYLPVSGESFFESSDFFLTFDSSSFSLQVYEESSSASLVSLPSHGSILWGSLGSSSSSLLRLETVEMLMGSLVVVTEAVPFVSPINNHYVK